MLQFHILVNVAVGGMNGFFPDDVINRGDNGLFAQNVFAGLKTHTSVLVVEAMWRRDIDGIDPLVVHDLLVRSVCCWGIPLLRECASPMLIPTRNGLERCTIHDRDGIRKPVCDTAGTNDSPERNSVVRS